MFRSLWFKLAGAFVIVVLVTLMVILRVVVNVTERELTRFTEARTDFARSLVPTVMWEGLPPDAIPELPLVPPVSNDTRSGITIGRDEDTFTLVVPGEVNSAISEIVERAAEGGSTSRQFLIQVQNTSRMAIAVAGITAIILGTIIFRQFMRPLGDLRAAVHSLAEGDMSVRVPVKSRDEVGRVAAAFNQMAAQLERQEQLRQQMVADVAHELRTPLSIMQGNIEAMMDGLIEPNPAELEELHDEVQRLARMIEDLRLLSLADAGQLELNISPFDARGLIERVVGLMSPLAESNQVKLLPLLPEQPVVLVGDEDKLQQAITNLIDNGIRHASPGNQVAIDVAHDNQSVYLSVSDNGPGIPADELPNLFNRFWRGDKSRSRHSGGSGLGLSIVKQIVELHRGSVQVVSSDAGGSRFTITLPRQTQA